MDRARGPRLHLPRAQSGVLLAVGVKKRSLNRRSGRGGREQDPFQNRSGKFSDARMSGTSGSMTDRAAGGRGRQSPATDGLPGEPQEEQKMPSLMSQR